MRGSRPSVCPYISPELMAHLENAYPDRAPEKSDDIDTIRFKSGQVSVVRSLRQKFNEQQKENRDL